MATSIKLEKLNTNKKNYLTTEDLVSLWDQYIDKIRSKGYRTGILGDADDMRVLMYLKDRIRKRIDTLPARIRKQWQKYGKTTRKNSASDDSKTSVISVGMPGNIKQELKKIAASRGVSISSLVYDLIDTYLAGHMAK